MVEAKILVEGEDKELPL